MPGLWAIDSPRCLSPELFWVIILVLPQSQADTKPRLWLCATCSCFLCLCSFVRLQSFYRWLNGVLFSPPPSPLAVLINLPLSFVSFSFLFLSSSLCLSPRLSFSLWPALHWLQRNSWLPLTVWECWLWPRPWRAPSSTTWPKRLPCRISQR